LTATLDNGERLTSLSVLPRGKKLCLHSVGGWVGPRNKLIPPCGNVFEPGPSGPYRLRHYGLQVLRWCESNIRSCWDARPAASVNMYGRFGNCWCFSVQVGRWRQQALTKRLSLPTKLHIVTFGTTAVLKLLATV